MPAFDWLHWPSTTIPVQSAGRTTTGGVGMELTGSAAFAAPARASKPVPSSPEVRKGLVAPDGYKLSGAVRPPRGEWFLDTDQRPAKAVFGTVSQAYPILEPTQSEEGDVEAYRPTPPRGWRITGRGEIPDGGYFMATGDSRVWKKGSGIYKRLYAWIAEPTLKPPANAPAFTLTGEYRLPKPGEWFCAKGSGPAAAVNDPVRLGPYDPPISGPRWILELKK